MELFPRSDIIVRSCLMDGESDPTGIGPGALCGSSARGVALSVNNLQTYLKVFKSFTLAV